ncbi:glucan biosynthesis protein D, partial [Thioclava sp. BHET1]
SMTDEPSSQKPLLTRRRVISAGGASVVLAAATTLPEASRADTSAPAQPAAPAAPAKPAEADPGQKFSFDWLTEQMRTRAKADYKAPDKVTGILGQLKYDDYQRIQYNPDRARWSSPGSMFRVDAFHLGWLFDTPVELYEVTNGIAREMVFTTDDFIYHGDLASRVPKGQK